MNISTENLAFVLQNNPEHLLVNIVQASNRHSEAIDALDDENKNILSSLMKAFDYINELKERIKYLEQPWYKKIFRKRNKKFVL